MVTLSLCAILLTVTVDPYRMYGSRPIPGLTAMKPFAYRHSDFVKEYLIERMKPRTLLLGNSRVEVALDPQSPLWPTDDRPVFNGAESGHDLATALVRLRHAMEIEPPRLIVVAADFADFLGPDVIQGQDILRGQEVRTPLDRGGHPNAERSMQIWKDRLATTLTIDAVLDSVATVLEQDPASGVTMTEEGFNPHHDFDLISRREGYHAMFAQKYRAYVAQYEHNLPQGFAEPLQRANFRYLYEIVQIAVAGGARLIIYISPYHCSLLDLWHADGLWPSFEAWKRALVAVIDEAAGSHRNLVTILDFSGYSKFAMEAVPASNDRVTAMRWYWESGHYKSALGEHIIARIMGSTGEFGQELTATTIDQVLRDIADGDRDVSVRCLVDGAR